MKSFPEYQVLNALVELFKHKANSYKHLEKVRLNPDFSKGTLIRNDLEFFIP